MKLLRPFVSVVAAMLCGTAVWAAIPSGYYSSLNGKKNGELKTAAYEIIHNFTKVSSYTALPDYFRQTDRRPDADLWWEMYSDKQLPIHTFWGLNREHSFPKSWWGGSTSVSAYVDLNHLYPSESDANQAKSNYPLGEVDKNSVTFSNGITTVGYPVAGQGGGAQKVFEPYDEYKGDFARTYFYMVTCYQNLSWKYTYMVNQDLYPTLNKWSIDLLMKWHREDQVSQKELDRNEQVYKIQNNRNPFIDLPELAEYLWGEKVGEAFTPGTVIVPPTGDPVLVAPVAGMDLDFGQVAIGNTAKSQVFVKGSFLQGTIDCLLYTGNSAMFKSSSKAIAATKVCSEEGYWLEISYEPTEVGEHSSRLLLSGDFGSVGVALKGKCFPEPVLSACTAKAPTDIQPDRYTANWDAPSGEEIDYYIVTRTRYAGGNVFTEELTADETFLEIFGFDESDSESYSVQSVRLDKRSPMSNVIFVDHTGVTGVEVGEPLVVQTFPGIIRFICSQPQTGCRIYDPAGRLVRVIDEIHNNLDVEMPYGVYLVVTDQHSAPVKVSVK